MRRSSWPTARFGPAVGAFSVLALLGYPAPLAWLGLVGLVGLAALRWRQLGSPLPASPFNLPLALYLAGALVGWIATVRPDMAEVRLAGLLGALGAFFILIDRVRSPRTGRCCVGALLLITATAAPLLLVLIAPDLRLDRLPGPLRALGGPIDAIIPPSEPLRQAVLGSENIGQRYRFSTAGLGLLAAFGMGLALGPLLAGPGRRARMLGWIALGYFTLLLLASANRTAILSAALVPAVMLAMRYRWALVGLLVATALGVSLLSGRVALPTGNPLTPVSPLLPDPATDPGPLYERFSFWQNYIYLLQDFPLTGVGLGLRSVANTYKDRFLPVDPGFNHSHNMFLQSYLEQGVLGFVGLLGFVAVGLVIGARTLRRVGDPATRLTALSASGATLTLIFDGLTGVTPLTTVGMVMMFGAVALWSVAGRVDEQVRAEVWVEPSARPHGLALPQRGAVLFVGLLVVLATPAILFTHGTVAGPDRVVSALAGRLFLNLGAVELNKAIFDHEPDPDQRKQHLSAADRFLQQSLSLAPDDPAVYRNLAELAIERSAPVQARNMLAKAMERGAPNDSLFLFQVGRLYRETGSIELAIWSWGLVDRTMGAWSCSSTDTRFLRWGLDLLESRRWSSAAQVIQAAIQVTPTDRRAYQLLTTATLGQDNRNDAVLAVMEELARAHPDIPWPLLEIVKLHEQAGRLNEAQRWNQHAEVVRNSTAWVEQQRKYQPVRECAEFLALGDGRNG